MLVYIRLTTTNYQTGCGKRVSFNLVSSLWKNSKTEYIPTINI